MSFLFQAFNQLGFCLFCRKAGYFFEPADMFLLVFFELASLDIHEVYLAIQVFFDRFIFLNLFVEICFFLTY
jgi:hypothetical protein